MDIDEEKGLFEQACFKHCQFLEQDYNCTVVEAGKGKIPLSDSVYDIDISVVYQNATTSAKFLTVSYGQELGVSLCRVVDGQPSKENGDCYALRWIYLFRQPARKNLFFSLSTQDKLAKSDKDAKKQSPDWLRQYKTDIFNRAFSRCSDILKQYASDVLTGDFTVFKELSSLTPTEWNLLINKSLT